MSVEGLYELRRDLRVAQVRIVDEAEKIGKKGALVIKQAMAADAAAATPKGYAAHFPRSISYDSVREGSTVHFEIGPDKDRQGAQGALGNLMAFGSRNNAPVWDHAAGLEEQGPVVGEFLAKAGERLLS